MAGRLYIRYIDAGGINIFSQLFRRIIYSRVQINKGKLPVLECYDAIIIAPGFSWLQGSACIVRQAANAETFVLHFTEAVMTLQAESSFAESLYRSKSFFRLHVIYCFESVEPDLHMITFYAC